MAGRAYMVVDSQGRVVEYGSCGQDGWDAWQPRDPDHVRHEIAHELHFQLDHGGGARRMRVDPPSDEQVGVCHCGKAAVHRKNKVTISVSGESVRIQNGRIVADTGAMLTVSHDAPRPMKLWVNHRPVAGPELGKMTSMQILADASGEFTFDLHCPHNHADKVVVLVMPKSEGS